MWPRQPLAFGLQLWLSHCLAQPLPSILEASHRPSPLLLDYGCSSGPVTYSQSLALGPSFSAKRILSPMGMNVVSCQLPTERLQLESTSCGKLRESRMSQMDHRMQDHTPATDMSAHSELENGRVTNVATGLGALQKWSDSPPKAHTLILINQGFII